MSKILGGKSIGVDYIGPSDTKGARLKAYVIDGNRRGPSITISKPDEAARDEGYIIAAELLRQKMNWKGELTGVSTFKGFVFGFENMAREFSGVMNMRRNPIKGPGKYEGETYAVKYAHENPDDELGDVQGFGWFGNFSGKIKGRGPFHIITTENDQGFVSGEFYDTEKIMLKNWARIEKEYEEFEDGAE